MVQTGSPAACRPVDRQLLMLGLFGATALLLALLATAQAGLALAHHGQPVPWTGLLKARLVESYLYALYMPGLCWLVRRRPIDAAGWPRALPLLLAVGIAAALTKEALYVAIGNWFRPATFHLPTILAEDFSAELLVVAALIGIAHALVFHQRASDRPTSAAAVSSAAEPTLVARGVGGHHLIRARDVERVEAQENYVRLSTPHGRFLIRETMAGLADRLPAVFLRVHRRFIVNADEVTRVEPLSHGRYRLHLKSGDAVISGRSYNAVIRAMLAGVDSSPTRPHSSLMG